MKRNKIIRWYNKIKGINHLGNKCASCGNRNIKHLSFHHISRKTKESDINDMLECSWFDIENEINKCVLLCHNCHAEYHYNEESSYLSARDTKKTFIEYKGGECQKCGYSTCQAALSFHHLVKSTKLFNLSITTKIFRSILDINNEFKTELDKCELLCNNCHNEEQILDDGIIEYVICNFNKIIIRHKSKKVDREAVKKMYENGIKQIDIARKFNVSKGTMSDIIKEIKRGL